MGFPMTVARVIERNRIDASSILADDVRRVAEDAVTLDRRRIRAAVEALPTSEEDYEDANGEGWTRLLVDVSRVLDIVEATDGR